MTPASNISTPLPPQLSMDEYADWVESTVNDCDPVLAARQKHMEERIVKSFRMTSPRSPSVAADAGHAKVSDALRLRGIGAAPLHPKMDWETLRGLTREP